MTDLQVRATIYLSLAASVLLAVVILLLVPTHPGAVLGLWATGLLTGMAWQTLICRKHDVNRRTHD